ncbi:hypothetical protein V8C40DRAFT_231002 [Trichoderma camerunense]
MTTVFFFIIPVLLNSHSGTHVPVCQGRHVRVVIHPWRARERDGKRKSLYCKRSCLLGGRLVDASKQHQDRRPTTLGAICEC